MHLDQRLEGRRKAILERWTELALEIYPTDSTGFLSREKDRFRNPVGHATRDGLAELLEGLLADRPTERMTRALDDIVRIRAVQELSPAEAVGFVFLLKRALRETLGPEGPGEERAALESRIDRLALDAFDHYVRCREKVYELRLNEIRRRTDAMRQAAGVPALDPDGGCGA